MSTCRIDPRVWSGRAGLGQDFWVASKILEIYYFVFNSDLSILFVIGGSCRSQKKGPVDISALNTQQLKPVRYTSYNSTVRNYASPGVHPESVSTDLICC